MRAVRLDVTTGRYTLVEVPRARPAAGEVLVRVGAAAIGRTDLDVLETRLVTRVPGRTDIVPGHEVAGFVAAPGAGVDGWPLNRRVVVHPVIASGRPGRPGRNDANDRPDELIGLDRDGGWAAYVSVPAGNLVVLPPTVSVELAAILSGTVATGWAALTGHAGPRPSESLAVWGIGGLGMPAVQVGRFIGAAPVVAIDPRAQAREDAQAAGADVVLDPGAEDFAARLRAAVPGGPDVALETSGQPDAVAQAVGSLARNGRAILLGLTGSGPSSTDRMALSAAGHQVVGHFGSQVQDLVELVTAVELGRLELSRSIGPVYPLEDAPQAIARAAAESGAARILLRPEAPPSRY